MPDGADAITVRVLGSIHDLPARAWDDCAGTDNPFTSHAFLAALEDSGSVSGKTGWLPRHLAVFDAGGRLLATMPLYLKSHSYGEYVFDWSWAEAYELAGGRYYPKLQAAVPFTPVTGRRLLVRQDAPRATCRALAATAVRLAERLEVSSLHITFPTEAEIEALGSYGFLVRLGYQFHWENRGYSSFDDFLGDLASRKRKAIRKERESVAASGIVLRSLNGPEIEPRHWDVFWRFYLDTADRKWGRPYLNRAFFRRLGETMADRVVLVMAETQDGEPVGGALNLLGRDAIYGRYWGSTEAWRFLHFEACYYRAIDYAIEHGLARVEAGAQGEHKVQRGYLPQPTWSAHWIAPSALRQAVQRFLEAERPAVEATMRELGSGSPFRRDENR